MYHAFFHSPAEQPGLVLMAKTLPREQIEMHEHFYIILLVLLTIVSLARVTQVGPESVWEETSKGHE